MRQSSSLRLTRLASSARHILIDVLLSRYPLRYFQLIRRQAFFGAFVLFFSYCLPFPVLRITPHEVSLVWFRLVRVRLKRITLQISFTWRIPNGGSIGAFRCDHRNFFRHLHLIVFGIESGPTGCWNLNDPYIVKSALTGIEVWVLPYGD